jgi:galactokinase
VRLAGPAIALVALAFALLPASAGATSECKNLVNCAANASEWVEIQPHAANQFTALACPGLDQVAVGLDWTGPAVDKVFVDMAAGTEVGAGAAGAPVELQQDVVCK